MKHVTKTILMNTLYIIIMILCLSFCSCKEDHSEFNVKEYDKKFSTKFLDAFPLLAKEILDYTKLSKGVCIDLGCGPGYLGFAIAERSNLAVYSLDIAPQAIELVKDYSIKKNLTKRVFPTVGDVHKLPYKNNFADLVVSRGSIPFWTDKVKAFSEIIRVLKPGGFAYIGCGFGLGYKNIVENREFKDRKPPKKFTHDQVINSLLEAGIKDYTVLDDYNRGYWIIIRN